MRWTVYPQSSFVERREGRLGHARIGMYVDHQKGLVDIYSVRVPIAHRGKGEAKRALDEALQVVDALQYDAVLAASPLDRRTRRHDLERFYTSRGFRPTGRTINMAGDREMWRSRRSQSQRDPVLDKKKLQKEIDKDIAAGQKRKLRQLREELMNAHKSERSACGAARTAARARIQKLRQRRERIQSMIRQAILRERQARNGACASKRSSEAARQAWRAEKAYQASLKRSAASARMKGIRKVGTRAERREESEDEVRHNIPPHLVPLWNRVKRSIRASSRKSRTEAFLEYAEEHPDEVYAHSDDATDRLIADLERQARAGRRW